MTHTYIIIHILYYNIKQHLHNKNKENYKNKKKNP